MSILHSQSDVIRQLLVSAGVGSMPPSDANQQPGSWLVYCEVEPPTAPDEMILLQSTMGPPFGRNSITGETIELHGVMIRVRSSTPRLGAAKANEIAAMLDDKTKTVQQTVAISNEVGDASYLVGYVSRGGVRSLGPEKNFQGTKQSNRYIFVVNAIAPLTQL